MEQEPRKATDILLELESKVDGMLDIIKTLDFNIKILSNKLNEIMKGLDKQQQAPPKIVIETVQSPPPMVQASVFAPSIQMDPERAVPITAESKLPQSDSPQGFRRTSRPESYIKEKATPPSPLPPPPKNTVIAASVPPPGRSAGETVETPKRPTAPVSTQPSTPAPADLPGVVPVEQRVVDKSGKSVFLADVEITNVLSGEQVFKNRTNGTGKWMAPLPLGTYQVVIRKHESITKTKVESMQTIKIDGSVSPYKLPMVIIK